MKYIVSHSKFGILKAQIDDDMFEFLNKFKWQPVVMRDGKPKYLQISSRGIFRHKTMHRLVLGVDGKARIFDVSFIDGNGFNNQRSNLKLVVRFKNLINNFNYEKENYK